MHTYVSLGENGMNLRICTGLSLSYDVVVLSK